MLTGVLGMCHALIANKAGFYVLRCLLGLAEAGGGSSAGHLLAQFFPKDRCAGPGFVYKQDAVKWFAAKTCMPGAEKHLPAELYALHKGGALPTARFPPTLTATAHTLLLLLLLLSPGWRSRSQS
jgi:hypothetical protein